MSLPSTESAVRVAVVVSHPIQHFCPQYSSWAQLERVELRVFFASQHGLKAYKDKNFDRVVQWEGLDLNFPHEFLPGAEDRQLGREIDAPALKNRLADFSPQILVVYGYSQALQRRAMAWATDADIPLFMIADSELRGRKSRIKRLAKSIILPKILAKVDRFLTVGDANEAYYRQFGVTDERFIRCFFPIDVNKFDAVLHSQQTARARIRARHSIPDDHCVVLCVGKLVPWKRQSDLVDFSNSVSSTEKITVILAGTGPEEASLRRRAHRQGTGGVVFAGFIPPAELIEYYCASDIYTHCSEHEPHSLAISEAIYCGLPIVVSHRCGSYGPSDDVRVGLNGDVYQCADAAGLRAAITRLARSDERRQSMGVASAEIARLNQRLAHGRALIQAIESLPSA